jgi:hypothetical protein
LGEGLRAWLGDHRGSSTRSSPVLSGGSTLSVARVLVQTALPRESCSTLPLGPFCCRLKSGRRIFTVSTMPYAPIPQGIRCSSLKHRFWIVLQLGHRMRFAHNSNSCPDAKQYYGKVVNGIDRLLTIGALRFPQNQSITSLEAEAKAASSSGPFSLDAILFGKWRD